MGVMDLRDGSSAGKGRDIGFFDPTKSRAGMNNGAVSRRNTKVFNNAVNAHLQ